jgi:hypothetical protein
MFGKEDLRKILWRLDFLINLEVLELAALDDLKAQVEANTNIEASAVILIQGIAQQLKDAIAAGDPAALAALADKLKTSATALADAITANTPV